MRRRAKNPRRQQVQPASASPLLYQSIHASNHCDRPVNSQYVEIRVALKTLIGPQHAQATSKEPHGNLPLSDRHDIQPCDYI
jgi:hypothetical protein